LKEIDCTVSVAAKGGSLPTLAHASAQKGSVLVRGGVAHTLFRMAFPMLAGTFAMTAYNLTDAYFVGHLGTDPMAAMALTFPVIMLLTFVAGGIGTGVTTLVSHAIGRHDHDDAARLVTHGIALTVTFTTTFSVLGYLSINPVFRRLGADAETLPLVAQYMHIWYLAALTMSLPMMGNGILISCGDSKGASRFMIFGALLNAALNPILIRGYMGLPAMGIRGSALATVIAQAASTAWLLYLLHSKHHLLRFHSGNLHAYLASFRRILGFAIPCILSMVLMPVSAAVITWLVSQLGHAAIAACGTASRLEMFAFVVPMALGMSLTPFISQNFGADRLDRIRRAKTVATSFALLYGGGAAVVFFSGAPLLARLFSSDPQVIAVLVIYFHIIPFGYGMMETHRYCGFVLTGLQKPSQSMVLNIIRVLVLLIPLSWAGAHFFGVRGLFAGRLITDLTVGTLGLLWVSFRLRHTEITPTNRVAIPAASAEVVAG
jgi:putative MATE family efflux protein